jgi:hypothetical protein
MNGRRFLESREGQIAQYWKRIRRSEHYDIDLEPQGKKKGKQQKRYAKDFQQKVLAQQPARRKRPFRGEVAIDLLYVPTIGPQRAALDRITKNVLDILGQGIEGIGRNAILYHDDVQVKYLSASYLLVVVPINCCKKAFRLSPV